MTRRDSGAGSSSPQPQDAPGNRQRGFAYLIALFMVLGVIIASQIAVKNIATEGRREREADMIWRGEQYTRAIRLYYRKAGHYPQDLDELEKGLPDLHFLRYAATKDPMNAADGAWGYIYVNAAGQLIGSSKYASLQQMALIDLNGGQLPTTTIAGATPVSSMGSQTTGPSLPPADSPTQAQGSSPFSTSSTGGSSLFGPSPSSTSSPLAGSPSTGLFGASNPIASQKPTGPVDGPVLGAFLTGVVSKSARPSVKVYNGGKKYSEWEFIWNPLEDQARATQQGLAPQGAVPGQPGQPAGATGAPSASGIISSLFGGAAAPGAAPQGSAAGGSPTPQQSQPTQ